MESFRPGLGLGPNLDNIKLIKAQSHVYTNTHPQSTIQFKY